MAAVGKGDPRWIVESRADGQNVNAWHWSEKDLTPWAHKRLKDDLTGLVLVTGDTARARIDSATSVDGDVTLVTRKGRTRYFYDLSAKLKWSGSVGSGDGRVDIGGTLTLEDVEQDSDADDFALNVSCDGAESDAHRRLKELVRAHGFALVRDKVAAMASELRTMAESAQPASAGGGGDGKDSASKAAASAAKSIASATKAGGGGGGGGGGGAATSSASASSSSPSAASAPSGTIQTKYTFRCRPEDLFDCFTVVPRACAFTQSGSARVSAEAGAEFSLYDGFITGSVVAAERPTRLEQRWRLRDWPDGHYSSVTLRFEHDAARDCTTMRLKQTGVPDAAVETTKRGWSQQFVERIRQVFGYPKA